MADLSIVVFFHCGFDLLNLLANQFTLSHASAAWPAFTRSASEPRDVDLFEKAEADWAEDRWRVWSFVVICIIDFKCRLLNEGKACKSTTFELQNLLPFGGLFINSQSHKAECGAAERTGRHHPCFGAAIVTLSGYWTDGIMIIVDIVAGADDIEDPQD